MPHEVIKERLTREQAETIIDYLETMEERLNHQSVMRGMNDKGYSDQEVDAACRALGAIAKRDYSIL